MMKRKVAKSSGAVSIWKTLSRRDALHCKWREVGAVKKFPTGVVVRERGIIGGWTNHQLLGLVTLRTTSLANDQTINAPIGHSRRTKRLVRNQTINHKVFGRITKL